MTEIGDQMSEGKFDTSQKNDYLLRYMVISVTDFKTHCLRVLREVEETDQPVEVSRQGRVRFRIVPVRKPETPAWKRLRQSGTLKAKPGESVLSEADFDANR